MSPRDGLSVVRDLPFLVSRSLGLDVRTARLSAWPLRRRAALLTSKHVAIARLLRGSQARLSVGGTPFRARELVDVGTLQAAIADTHDLLAPGAEATTAEPDVVAPVEALGSVVLGGVDPRVLTRAGRMEERSAGAAGRLARMFAAPSVPWNGTRF